MVRQVKKYLCVFVAALILIAASCGTVSAAYHNNYTEGTFSTTFIQYAKDTISKVPLNCNYVFYRIDRNHYVLGFSDMLFYESGDQIFYCNDEMALINIINEDNNYYYFMDYDSDYILESNGGILYSNLGNFPDLIERGSKYETLITILISIACCCVLIRSIFTACKRR